MGPPGVASGLPVARPLYWPNELPGGFCDRSQGDAAAVAGGSRVSGSGPALGHRPQDGAPIRFCSHSSTAAKRPSSTRNEAASSTFWRSRSRRVSLALICASRTRLRASDFELIFTIAEPYDVPAALIYHIHQHHRVPICRPTPFPVPLPDNTTRAHPHTRLTTAHQHQHISVTPTHHTPHARRRSRRTGPSILARV
jgi:hypothetical protein